MADRPIKLLYVMGFSRSGTTVLANSIGSIDGFTSVGELSRHLWVRALGTDECGCGKPLPDCEFWQEVLTEALGAFPGEEEVQALKASARRFLRTRYIPRYLRRSPGDARLEPELRGYVETLGRVYQAVAERSGARVVVDASKRPADAAALRLATNVETYFVHVVRDPRAVAHSWTRPAQRGLTQYKPRRIGLQWVKINAAARVVDRWAGPNALVVRYEDFVRDPRRVLESIVLLTGEPAAELPLVGDARLELKRNHLVSANPRHPAFGLIELKEDDEWMSAMPRTQRALVTTLSSPFLRAFDYSWRARPTN